MAESMDPVELGRLARSAVDKVDLHGKRGVTLLSMQEIEALAMVAVLSGLLAPRDGAEAAPQTPKFKTRRKSSE